MPKWKSFITFFRDPKRSRKYANRFTRMMRYTPGETDSDKRKMYFFKKGLNTRLKVALSGHTCYTLWEMINKVLEIERDR